jgi:hypothetical protein
MSLFNRISHHAVSLAFSRRAGESWLTGDRKTTAILENIKVFGFSMALFSVVSGFLLLPPVIAAVLCVDYFLQLGRFQSFTFVLCIVMIFYIIEFLYFIRYTLLMNILFGLFLIVMYIILNGYFLAESTRGLTPGESAQAILVPPVFAVIYVAPITAIFTVIYLFIAKKCLTSS